MSDQILLNLPDDISERAKRIAQSTAQPIEQVLIDHLRSLQSPLPELEPEVQAEIDALIHLSDDALWTIAREQLPETVQRHAHELMDKNAEGSISEQDVKELDDYVNRADRLMLRKAEAAQILQSRGYSFNQEDFKAPNE
ncbi:MAG: hypothetical protein RLP44_00585 [Aggregatilineales bacterium]